MIFRILASSLVAIQVLVSNAGAQSTDPCASVGTATLSTLADVYRCFNQIPASSSFKTEHVDTLKSFLEIYPFTDLNIDTTEPLFPNKVDIEAELDKLAADTSITTQFEFYSRIALLVKSLKDAHFSYSPSCITTFNFVQPWHIGAVYPNGGGTPQIKIINTVFSRTVPQQWQEALGATPSTFVNYTIQSIDDVDAVQYVKEFATKFSGFARDPESNFNRVLYRRLYTDGQWVGRTGPFYVTNFLGHDASPTRKYVLVPPNGGSSVTFSVPWIGVPEVDNFSSTSQYQRRYCTDAESSALVRRDNEETSGKSLILGEVPIPDSDLHVPTYRPTYRPLPDLSAVASISASVMQSSIASFNIRGGVSAGAPKVSLQSPMAKDNNTAFYMLDDGITGVWVFATVSPDGEYDDVVPQWLGTITGGLRGLEAKGARRLIIDVSGNGGGYSCVADALAEYLIKSTPNIIDQVRLTPTMQALLATQFFGPNDNGVKPINATNILTNTITKTRGGRDATLSGFFTFDCTGAFPSSLPRLDRGWLPADVVVVSDGGCGSACACMVRSLRDAHKIKSYVYGGSSGKPYTPTSFEGGIVLPYSSIATYPNNVRTLVTPSQLDLLPKNFTTPIRGQIPVTQGYSRLGRLALEYPAEWIPYPADEWLGIANPSDRISVWNAVAAKMADPATAPVTTGTGKSGAGRTSMGGILGASFAVMGMMVFA